MTRHHSSRVCDHPSQIDFNNCASMGHASYAHCKPVTLVSDTVVVVMNKRTCKICVNDARPLLWRLPQRRLVHRHPRIVDQYRYGAKLLLPLIDNNM
jgi:hypothetical protein